MYALCNDHTYPPCLLRKFSRVFVLPVRKAGHKMGVPYDSAASVCPRVLLSELLCSAIFTKHRPPVHTCSFPTSSNNDMTVVPIFEAGAILAPPSF
jgi:hypothetical protein